MTRPLFVLTLCVGIVAALSAGGGAAPAVMPGAPVAARAFHVDLDAACGDVPEGRARCFVHLHRGAGPSSAASPAAVPAGLGPVDFRSAYGGAALSGSTETVAVIDAFDDPTAESDLATYRNAFNLPPCTSATGCFRKVNQRGATAYPAVDNGWALEISLDLDAVSAMCPQCRLILVEADDNQVSNLATANVEGGVLGAHVTSNSYGATEFASETIFDNNYRQSGVLNVAANGDGGYGAVYPAAVPTVLAVGGTTLTRLGTLSYAETAWSGTGSGCSAYEPKPGWQTDTGCARRTIGDLAADADPATGAAVYATTGQPGWVVAGGTSLASPLIAGMAASTVHASTPERLYRRGAPLRDIVSGSNGTCVPSYLCTAGPGYDGPTGLGSPAQWSAFGPLVTAWTGKIGQTRSASGEA